MKTLRNDSYTYMGLLDDSVVRYPWRFKVDVGVLNYLLTVELIHGKPVLLNDGYLVNNEIARAELLKRDGLLWELVRNGFVRVMARGGDQFKLHDMPLRMAEHIPTFKALVEDRIPGVQWTEFREALSGLDKQLRDAGLLVPWPSLDAGSGFLALVENLRERGASPHALGIGRHVGKTTFASFLDEVADILSKDTRGARTTWELTAIKYADDPDQTNAPKLFKDALMNLANEMYHYNMGILLTAEHGSSVSVQTQTSAAFDDLLIPPSLKFLVSDIPQLPRLSVPLAITQADPIRLASLVVPGSSVADSRTRWLKLRNEWEASLPVHRTHIAKEVRDAGEEYARRLSEFVGTQVKFKETEELVEFVVGDMAKYAVAAGAGLALSAAGMAPAAVAAGSLGGLAIGYAITRGRKRYLGSVFKKFRVYALEKTFTLPPAVAKASEHAMRTIKRRQVPSTIQITPSVVTALAPRLKRFER
ncbi:hypothetical protein WKW79_19525 [Variovorax robiniae]|uniref:Uncharacterized protein n=1 Tax=Variovorax robiniae TaxID=1836199 RepID=A0ABU8XCJ9_9BURK